MYTFVFVANLRDEIPDRVLRSSARITKKWMPALGEEIVESYKLLPECFGGWFSLTPSYSKQNSLICEFVDPRFAVLVFGHVVGTANDVGQQILRAWLSQGPDAVRELDGCFSAIIVDRRTAKITLISDAIGTRSLRYHASGGRLVVSPHDVALMSTGHCPNTHDIQSDKLPWKTRDLARSVFERLNAAIDHYAQFSEDGYDLLDMIYLHERLGVWGSMASRFTWQHRYWSPFMSTPLIRLAYRMPAPIADHASIHTECLRRYGGRAYWISVNGRTVLPLRGLQRLQRSFRTAHALLSRSLRKQSTQSVKSIEDLRSDMMAGPLAESISDILLSQDSFAVAVFAPSGVQSLLDQHLSRRRNHTQTLGHLVTMEKWRGLIQGVSSEASRERNART